MLVPQPGHQPAAGGVVLLDSRRGRASPGPTAVTAPSSHEHVDGFWWRHGIGSHGHDACAAHEEAGHGANAR